MPRELYGPLFSVKQAAEYLGIGRTRIYQMLNSDELEHIKDKKKNLIAMIVREHLTLLFFHFIVLSRIRIIMSIM